LARPTVLPSFPTRRSSDLPDAMVYPCEVRSNLLATHRLIVWALMLSGILLVSLGLVLAYTWAFPDVTCSGDLCLITWNIFAVPSDRKSTRLNSSHVAISYA